MGWGWVGYTAGTAWVLGVDDERDPGILGVVLLGTTGNSSVREGTFVDILPKSTWVLVFGRAGARRGEARARREEKDEANGSPTALLVPRPSEPSLVGCLFAGVFRSWPTGAALLCRRGKEL